MFLNRRSFFDPDSINLLLSERENWKFLKKATVEKRFGKGGDEKSNRIARYVFRLNDSTLPYACLFAKEIRRYSPSWLPNYAGIFTPFTFDANSISSIRHVQLEEKGVVIVILRESSAGIRGCGFLKLPATIAAID